MAVKDYPGIEMDRAERREELDAIYSNWNPRYEVWVIAPDPENYGQTYTRQYLAHDPTGYAGVYASIAEAEKALAWWENEYPMAWAAIYFYRPMGGDFIDQSWRYEYRRRTVKPA